MFAVSPAFAPASCPRFTPALFAGDRFDYFDLTVYEGAESGTTCADHTDGEFELSGGSWSVRSLSCAVRRRHLRPDDYVPEGVGYIPVGCAMVEPVDKHF